MTKKNTQRITLGISGSKKCRRPIGHSRDLWRRAQPSKFISSWGNMWLKSPCYSWFSSPLGLSQFIWTNCNSRLDETRAGNRCQNFATESRFTRTEAVSDRTDGIFLDKRPELYDRSRRSYIGENRRPIPNRKMFIKWRDRDDFLVVSPKEFQDVSVHTTVGGKKPTGKSLKLRVLSNLTIDCCLGWTFQVGNSWSCNSEQKSIGSRHCWLLISNSADILFITMKIVTWKQPLRVLPFDIFLIYLAKRTSLTFLSSVIFPRSKVEKSMHEDDKYDL